MSWIVQYKYFINDTARQVQLFMVCRQLGIILASIILAWVLPVEEVGVIEMLMFAGYLMTFFWSDALLRGYLSKKELHRDKQEVTNFFLLYFLGSILSMLILLAGQSFLIPLFTSRSDLPGLELYAFYQILVLPLWVAPFIGLFKGLNILLASCYVLIAPAFACWTGFNSLPGIEGILLGLFCYALVGFGWVLTQTKLKGSIRFGGLLKILWPATWPLVMYAVSTGLARSFDAWLVASTFTEADFAIFRYGAREFPIVAALSAGLSTILIPRLHDHLALGELKSRSIRLMHAWYPVIAVLMLASHFIFPLIYGDAYLMSASIFNIFLLLTLTQLFFPQSIMIARGDSRLLWYVSIAELCVNVGVSLLLLPYFGLVGIAWGTLIAFIFEKIILMTIIQRRYGIPSSGIMAPKVLFGYAFLLLSAYILSEWLFGA